MSAEFTAVDYLTYTGILLSQWGERRRLEPEIGLWLAVLEDAVKQWRFCQMRPLSHHMSNRQERVRRELEEWIATTRGVGSFDFVCEALGIEPARLRNEMRAWTAENAPVLGRRSQPRIARANKISAGAYR